MTAEFLNRNLNLQPQDIERMYFEYIKRTESAAVLWSFTVISLKPDIDYAWDSSVKERGPKPFHGFVEYARSTGYADQASASQYARSSGFNKWVGKLCPVD